jgi:hypothetical protein
MRFRTRLSFLLCGFILAACAARHAARSLHVHEQPKPRYPERLPETRARPFRPNTTRRAATWPWSSPATSALRSMSATPAPISDFGGPLLGAVFCTPFCLLLSRRLRFRDILGYVFRPQKWGRFLDLVLHFLATVAPPTRLAGPPRRAFPAHATGPL